MAKLERNRLMYFGSWTGSAIEEAAVVQYTGSGITNVTVTAATFGGKVAVSGEYAFTYSGTQWELNGTAITATEYGITVTGSPANGDTITVSYTAASGGWEALGKDNDSLGKELNPDTEIIKNVLGESTFKHSGYEPSINMETYYMDPSRVMYKHLLDVAMQELFGENDLLGYFAEAFFTSANKVNRTMSGYCYVRRAWFVPQSTGGDTSGVSIPYTIVPVGGVTKKNIVYDMATNQATITDIT